MLLAQINNTRFTTATRRECSNSFVRNQTARGLCVHIMCNIQIVYIRARWLDESVCLCDDDRARAGQVSAI